MCEKDELGTLELGLQVIRFAIHPVLKEQLPNGRVETGLEP
jgi:hypothetical protein